jgi:hypothetical protein
MQISIYNISFKIYMQIYMICGIGLCLRVGKKNLYVANEIFRTNKKKIWVENHPKASNNNLCI